MAEHAEARRAMTMVTQMTPIRTSDRPLGNEPNHRSSSVQTVKRTFALLEVMVGQGGIAGLSQLSAATGLPLPTTHRLVRTLCRLGYVRQLPTRQYALAPRLMGFGKNSSRMLSVWARPHLARLAEELGESANLATLDGDHIVYVAQISSRHSMRMVHRDGSRVLPHCTAVGKAILAKMPREQVRALLQRSGMPTYTPTTITDERTLADELDRAAQVGYAMDECELKLGMRCVAVPVSTGPSRLAISVSGRADRMSCELVERAVPLLSEACEALAQALSDDLQHISGARSRGRFDPA